ncbi:MAG TPA: spermidine/putrescine ABC transporter substrate-binding protein [Acidimicrobiales bacterium]
MSTPIPPRFNRRTFLAGTGVLGLGAFIGSSTLLSACGDDGGGSGGKSLFFENWSEYIDGETAAAFAKDTGIDFKYTEAYLDNDDYFAKVQPLLSKGDKIDPDILPPTTWMAARYIKLGWAQKLPLDKIPNAKNLREDLVKPPWDPTGEFTLPWQTGMTGIAYNLKATGGKELKSVADVFDPQWKGKVSMLTEMRDTIGLILLAEGKDPSKITTYDEAAGAFDKLEKAKNDGQIRQFTDNSYVVDLNAGNFAVSIAWSGDVLAGVDNPDVRFVFPEEGAMSWGDVMIWVKGSEKGDAVAKWMDYVYDPKNAARITAGIQYVPPVKGVKEEMIKMGGDAATLAESPLLFPDDATLKKLHPFGDLSEEEEEKFDIRFQEITGA